LNFQHPAKNRAGRSPGAAHRAGPAPPGLDNLSLMALSIAVGFVVDDAVS
jgi:hypothetical protein